MAMDEFDVMERELRRLRAALAAAQRDLAAAQWEVGKFRIHEFTRPLDEHGCCAVCHEAAAFLPHRVKDLETQLAAAQREREEARLQYANSQNTVRDMTGTHDEMEAEIETLRARVAALEGAVRTFLRGDGHFLDCPAPDEITHSYMPHGADVQKCIALRAALTPTSPSA